MIRSPQDIVSRRISPAPRAWWESDGALASFCAVVLAAMVALLVLAGCPSYQPPPTVHVVGVAATRALPVLVAIEEAQGYRAIAEKGAKTVSERKAATAPIEAAWEPFWKGWAVFQAAQNKWADAVAKHDPALAQLEAAALAAFCASKPLLPAGVPAEVLAVEGFACNLAK